LMMLECPLTLENTSFTTSGLKLLILRNGVYYDVHGRVQNP